MNISRISTVFAVSVTTAAIALAGAGPAAASGGGQSGVRAAGSCSAGSVWKIKAKPDHARVELELEIDTHRAGQTWTVGITDNKVQVFSGKRVTVAPSKSFTVALRAADRPGRDSVVGAARNTRTGETCTARVTL